MKKLCLFVLSLFLVTTIVAQSQKGYVHLKNGSVVKGKYQYSDDLKRLLVKSSGNLWVFDVAEVEKVSDLHSPVGTDLEEGRADSPFFLKTELGILIGNSNNNNSAPFSLSSAINYKVSPKFSTGVGLGLEFLEESYLPAFLNVEYKFRNSYSSPYVFLRGGYQVPLEDSRTVPYHYYYQPWSSSSIWPGPGYNDEELKSKGGVMINPGIGFERMFSSGFGLSIAFGYQFHRLNYTGEDEYTLKVDYNRLTIKLGIIFN